MDKSCWNIYKIFFKIGTLLLGGGYVILPLLQSELIEKRDWITDDELCEYYALSQSLPGLIAANVSIFTGFKLGRYLGAVAALAGVISPAFVSIILVASVLEKLVHNPFIHSIFWGVGVGVVILLYLAVKEMFPKSIFDKFTTLIFIYALVLSVFKVSPVFVILSSIFIGITYRLIKPLNEKSEGK